MIDSDEFIRISYWNPVKIVREGILSAIKQVAPKYSKGNLIDLGCGIKPYISFFQPYVDSYFGVDYHVAAEYNYGTSTNADLYCDCTETGLKSESFDTLLSTEVMEHIYNNDKYLEECHRLLKKNGIGIFTVPMSWRLHAEPYDYYRFTKFSLEKKMLENGFEILELRPLQGAFASIICHGIVFFSNRPVRNLFFRIFKKAINSIIFPLLNLLALKLDKIFWDDKFCLNILVVVRRV